MESKRAKVVMLPTDKVWQYKYSYPINMVSDDGLIFTNGKHIGKCLNDDVDLQEQYLYFTTDDEIKVGDYIYQTGCNFINKAGYNWKGDKNYSKIVATTDPKLITEGVPQPTKAFIEKYCRVGGIDEVEIEFITQCKNCLASLPSNCSFPNCKCIKNGRTEIKVNSHNEITIHPIKDSWNRKEVEEIVNLYEAIIHGDDHVMTFEDMQKRIKEIVN